MKTLAYGQFFGNEDKSWDLPGFSLSVLTPLLHAEDVPLHTHTQASVIFILSGRYCSSADGASSMCERGEVIFNPRGTVHRDSFVKPTGKYLALSMTEETSHLLHELPAIPGAATAYRSPNVISIAMRLYWGAHRLPNAAALDLEEDCWRLMSEVAGQKIWKELEADAWVTSARELMHDECGVPLSFKQLASRLGIHPVTLSKGFRKHFRCTPHQYVRRCRLQRALHLIRSTRSALAGIAAEAGFFDQSHLCHAFREEFGISPRSFRRALG